MVSDPFAIYRVDIYRGSVAASNIVDSVVLPAPDADEYPSPVSKYTSGTAELPGQYAFLWDVPKDAVAPDVYFDVWRFFGSDPRTGTDSLADHEGDLISTCNRFWVYPDEWYVDDNLQTVRFAFEPIDVKFNKPEVRPLEVGIMPLPLYDYNYNLVMPMIPYLSPTIHIETENGEEIVGSALCQMKERQGAYRSNPWVISYVIDTAEFLIGTYKYRIVATLPDGTTRASRDMYFSIL
jgi:hypothetical protein